MDEEFIHKIERPDSPQQQDLYDEGIEITENRLEKFGINGLSESTRRRLNYTYYHNWEHDDPQLMFLIRDPGKPGDHVVAETRNIDRNEKILDLIDIYQRIGARWLMGRNYAKFMREFLQTCEQEGLIDIPGDWWEYLLSGQFFDDFYMTDVVKYRVDEDPSDRYIQDCFTTHLFSEIEYVDPDIIFAFGKTPWKSLRDMVDTEHVETGARTKSSITEAQGKLFRTTKMPSEQLYVIPFLHMSPQNIPSRVTIDEFRDMLRSALQKAASEPL